MVVIDERTDAVGRQVVDASIKVHPTFGPGLLESVYEHCLAHELIKRGFAIQRQLAVPVTYDGDELEAGFRLDIVAERRVVVEVKAVEALKPIHEAQLLIYLRLSGHHLGYLINFNTIRLIDGLKRRVA